MQTVRSVSVIVFGVHEEASRLRFGLESCRISLEKSLFNAAEALIVFVEQHVEVSFGR